MGILVNQVKRKALQLSPLPPLKNSTKTVLVSNPPILQLYRYGMLPKVKYTMDQAPAFGGTKEIKYRTH